MSKKIICLLATFFPATAFAVTIDELREQVSKNTASITQMHAVYVVEDKDYTQGQKASSAFAKLEKKLEKAGETIPNIDTIMTANKVNSSRKEKIEYFIDFNTGDAKQIITDLRDIPKLLKENNLSPREKRNICQSKTILKNREYHLSLSPTENFPEDRSLIVLEKNDPNYIVISNKMPLGRFPSYYLTDAYDAALSKQTGGKLKIDTISHKHNEYTTTILCDPSLDYHVNSIKQYKDGTVTKEMSFTNYRTINKIPFPFRYSEKGFDKNGNINSEKTYTVEQVEFNHEFPPDTFKVSIPDNANFHDFAVSNVVYNLNEGGFWSMEDLLTVVTKNAEKFKNPTKTKCSK